MKNKTTNYEILESLTATDFEDFYKKKLLPIIAPIENRRIKLIEQLSKSSAKMKPLIIVLFIPLIILCFVAFVIPKENLNSLMHAAFVYSLILGIIPGYTMYARQKKQNIVTDFKAAIYNLLFTYIGRLKYYSPKDVSCKKISSLLQKKLRDTKFFNMVEAFSYDDYIVGKYNGLNLEIADVEFQFSTGTGNRYKTKEEVFFKGLWLEVDIQKNFSSSIVIRSDEGIIGNSSSIKKLSRVYLEDPVFERYFEVYSDNQVEARYILTTAFMERLIKIKNEYNTEMFCAFKNGKMCIAIANSKDWFAASAEHTFLDMEMLRGVLVDIVKVFSIVDILKVDDNIGL